ncbi:MAG: hypothetical protein GXP55_09965 [Deltaproteobacteria bacterium]|nr:hypothetical protein [Deltaproteobacteria bacterium]
MNTLSRLALLALLLPLTLLVFACEDEPQVEVESPEPVVSVAALPISLRRDSAAPSGAAHIEVAPGRLRLEGRTLFEMTGGHVPDAELVNDVITKLKAGLDTGSGYRSAVLRVQAATPWSTTLAIFDTLAASNITQAAFEVRASGTADTGYLPISRFEMVDEGAEITPFEGPGQRTWDEFKAQWQAAHDACREQDYVDCAYVPQNIADGGQVQMTLFARGNAAKIQFDRFGAEEAAAPARAQLLDGIPQAADAVADEELPPAVTAAFTWRARALTKPDSAVSKAVRGLCGAQPCAALVTAEGQTPSMRLISFLGAVYPDGAPAPILRFQRNPPGH